MTYPDEQLFTLAEEEELLVRIASIADLVQLGPCDLGTTRMIESMPEDWLAAVTAQIPRGRFADPAEIAAAVGLLASEEVDYITGVVLPVDGGLAM